MKCEYCGFESSMEYVRCPMCNRINIFVARTYYVIVFFMVILSGLFIATLGLFVNVLSAVLISRCIISLNRIRYSVSTVSDIIFYLIWLFFVSVCCSVMYLDANIMTSFKGIVFIICGLCIIKVLHSFFARLEVKVRGM